MCALSDTASSADRIRRIETSLLPTSGRVEAVEAASLMERLAQENAPGFSVAVIEGGDIAWARGYGVRDADHPDPVTPETVFQAGSVSKPVAAVAALRLVEEGRLTLDDDIGRWLTSWRVPPVGSWQPRLTLRQLLSHTAGLTVHGFQGYDRDTVLPTLVQVLDGAEPANSAPVRVDLIPGAQFRYSGGGYCVFQQLLVDVTGQSFPDLMRDLVLAPLGMAHSTYAQPLPESWHQRAASGHQPGSAPVEGCWAVYPEMAAAGLWTTPSDLARVALEVQRALAQRPGTLLSPEMVRMMLAPQFDQPTDDLDERIGLGFFLRGEGQAAQFRHTGSDRGFLCLFSGYERLGAGIVAMINARAGDVILEYAAAVARECDWPDYASPEPGPVDATLAGEYAVRPGYSLVVAQSDGTLSLRPTGQDALPLVQRSATRFAVRGLEVEVVFQRDETGTPAALVVRQGRHDLVATRVPLAGSAVSL